MEEIILIFVTPYPLSAFYQVFSGCCWCSVFGISLQFKFPYFYFPKHRGVIPFEKLWNLMDESINLLRSNIDQTTMTAPQGGRPQWTILFDYRVFLKVWLHIKKICSLSTCFYFVISNNKKVWIFLCWERENLVTILAVYIN